MRKVNISNAKKRDALVGFEAKPNQRTVFQVLKNGGEKKGIRVLKKNPKTDFLTLKLFLKIELLIATLFFVVPQPINETNIIRYKKRIP